MHVQNSVVNEVAEAQYSDAYPTMQNSAQKPPGLWYLQVPHSPHQPKAYSVYTEHREQYKDKQ